MKDEPLVEMKGIGKSFGGLRALDNVSINLYRGEVLALVGDNGAGKSTLIKILTGAYFPDEGEIYIEGDKVAFRDPKDSENRGIVAIYQDLALIPTIDAPGNLFLGRELKKSFLGLGILGIKFLDKKKMCKETRDVLHQELRMEITDLNRPVHVLSGGQQQAVAIGRAVHAQAKILIMDEPTSALGTKGMQELFRLIRSLKEKNVSIIIISHNLEHVCEISDRILVLRQGKIVGERKTCESNRSEIVQLIVGCEEEEKK